MLEVQPYTLAGSTHFATFTLQAYNITTIKESKGTIKEKDIVVWSATYPIISGPTAPPTGDIIKNEEARFVCLPNPLKERAKIVGNIIASNA